MVPVFPLYMHYLLVVEVCVMVLYTIYYCFFTAEVNILMKLSALSFREFDSVTCVKLFVEFHKIGVILFAFISAHNFRRFTFKYTHFKYCYYNFMMWYFLVNPNHIYTRVKIICYKYVKIFQKTFKSASGCIFLTFMLILMLPVV